MRQILLNALAYLLINLPVILIVGMAVAIASCSALPKEPNVWRCKYEDRGPYKTVEICKPHEK